MTVATLISFASWESRFLQGVGHLIEKDAPKNCIILFATEYADRTAENRNAIKGIVSDHNIPLIEIPVTLATSLGSWEALAKFLPANIESNSSVLFDISTAPREALWYTLHIFDALGCETRWIYHRPETYAEDWLSRNALSPRLLLKRSGVALPSRKTFIVALSGFDSERLAQLVERYEPTKCIVGRQTGDQLKNTERNTGFDSAFIKQKEIEIFDFDCYDASDEALNRLLERLPKEIWEEFNVIGASLGPKPSAITMFKLTQIHPEMGLVYIPSGEYNINYSAGIDLHGNFQGVLTAKNGIG